LQESLADNSSNIDTTAKGGDGLTNQKLRDMLKKKKIYLWQIAEKLGIHETTLVRRFRHELTAEQEQQVLLAVEEISLERGKEQD
jgi:hypothetical protein